MAETYGDYGVVTGIEGSDPSHAVAEVVFNNTAGEITGLLSLRDVEGLGVITVGTIVNADIDSSKSRQSIKAKRLDYPTDEDADAFWEDYEKL